MSNKKSFVGSPLLITHWDPAMYPKRPLPLIPELVIYLLAHGEVWIKEVDLFLNPKIAAFLSDPVGFDQFSSLVATKRVKVLIPDTSRDLDDPVKHPILSTAKEIVKSKRPLKSRPWKMTDDIRRLCEVLDTMLVAHGGLHSNGVVRHRTAPPGNRNVFADRFVGVLMGEDKRWRGRDQFKPRYGDTIPIPHQMRIRATGMLSPWEIRIAVGTPVARRPPHKAVRAAFPHTASTLGI